MKKIIIGLAIFLTTGNAFSQNSFTLEIVGHRKHVGKIYISIFNNEQSFEERKIYDSVLANSVADTLNLPLILKSGEYLFSIYQDINNNGELDTNLLGIPREPFGFSNYSCRSAPGDFSRHKILVNETTKKIQLHLYRL
ncbi:MAG: DUF2141 domain-containing protein [Bacteroidales bacterium]|nr:DUF2141 domain-containing protein [Bacteroidales bacterium]MCF8392145.1 DUF2141 domain-containing protein [Bacteroidales bacterium]